MQKFFDFPDFSLDEQMFEDYNRRMVVVSSCDERAPVYRAWLLALKPYQRSIWEFMLSTGLRTTDALTITYSDLRRGWIRERKTGFFRSIRYPIPPKPAGQASDYVFPNPRTDKPYHRSSFSRALSRAAADVGFCVPFGPHSARKMYALRVLRDTRDLSLVQAALNHKYLSTTLLYIYGHPHITADGKVVTYGE